MCANRDADDVIVMTARYSKPRRGQYVVPWVHIRGETLAGSTSRVPARRPWDAEMMMIAKDWASSQRPRWAWLQTAHPLAGLAAMGERTASRRVAYWRISEKLISGSFGRTTR